MILLTPLQAFNIFRKYIIENWELDSNTWEVSDVLSEASTDLEVACHTGGPTDDPAVWEDWKVIVDEVLQGKKLNESDIQKNDIYLTREQALKVMTCFLRERYWNENNDMLLKDAIADINQSLDRDNFESTAVWKQWLECVPKGLEFKEIFDDAYFEQLEMMRRQYWERKGKEV